MRATYRWRVAALAAIAFTFIGCGSDKSTGPGGSDLVTVPFSSQTSWCSGYAPGVAHVTQLLGPRGSTTGNPLAGAWVARGTYDIRTTGYTSAQIEIGFVGSVVTGENGQSITEAPHVITSSNLSGTFEARGGFLRIASGPGTPTLMISSGSEVLDCVLLQ